MNKLPTAKRVQMLSMLCEGASMRSVSRVADVSINTVGKLLADAGRACAGHHDKAVRGVKAKRVQCDEIWSFAHCKQKNVATAKAAPADAGDVWTWTALDADSKLIVGWLVGDRDAEAANALMLDVAGRLGGGGLGGLAQVGEGLQGRHGVQALRFLALRAPTSSGCGC